jgi:hypothetical protein
MIRYTLICAKRHEFESWFANSAAFDKQEKARLLDCPICGSRKVKKALMAPRLARRQAATPLPAQEAPSAAAADEAHSTEPRAQPSQAQPSQAQPGQLLAAQMQPGQVQPPQPVAMMSPQEHEVRRKLKELRDHLVSNAENVGPRFPEEARKIHYGESEHRSIYGIASPKEAKELHDEGIEFSPLPVLPEDRN